MTITTIQLITLILSSFAIGFSLRGILYTRDMIRQIKKEQLLLDITFKMEKDRTDLLWKKAVDLEKRFNEIKNKTKL